MDKGLKNLTTELRNRPLKKSRDELSRIYGIDSVKINDMLMFIRAEQLSITFKKYIKNKMTILDVGSGFRPVVPLSLKNNSDEFLLYSIDLDKSNLKKQRYGVKEFCPELAHKIKYLCKNAKSTGLKKDIVDLAVFHHSIEEIYEHGGWDEISKIFKEMHRILKPNGVVLILFWRGEKDPTWYLDLLKKTKPLLKENGFKTEIKNKILLVGKKI